MSKFLSLRKEYVSYVLVLLVGLFMSGVAAYATTTVSTSVVSGGGVYASSSAAVTGTVTVYGGANVASAYGIDVSTAGALNLGTTTATSVIIGSATANVGIASTSPYVALGVTGTTTSSAGMVIGSSGTAITQMLWGTCTYNPGASIVGSSTRSTNCTGATGVRSGDKIFITPNSLATHLVMTSASTTSTNDVIQVSVYNTGVIGTITPASATWTWMAMR